MAPFPGTAGLILAGGASSRLGRDKAGLRFGAETLLERAVRRMRAVAHPVLVAVAPASAVARGLPQLPEGAVAVPDRSRHEGPLLGMAAGFRRLRGEAERVLLTPVDMPFFAEPWLVRLAEGLSRAPVVLYRYEGVINPLAAGYRLELLPKLERLIAQGARGAKALAEGEETLVLELEALWRPGAGHPPLLDVDSGEDYRDALRWEGFGDAGGAAVWIELRAPEISGEEREAPPPLPLWASTPARALDLAARVYPEHAAALRRERARGAARMIRNGEAAPLDWDDALRTDDHLVCEC